MKLADMQIFPTPEQHGSYGGKSWNHSAVPGMTFRQYAAVKAMQPLLASMYGAIFERGLQEGLGKTTAKDATELRKLIAEAACTFADELIAELEKP